MVDEERIKIMTKCACYESGEGRRELGNLEYSKRDYVHMNILRTEVAVTLGYLVVVAIWAVAHLDYLIDRMNDLNLRDVLTRLGVGWAVVLVFYYFAGRVVYALRYRKMHDRAAEYYRELKKLQELYRKGRDLSPRMLKEEEDLNAHDDTSDY